MIWKAQGLKTRSPEGGMKEPEIFGMQTRDSQSSDPVCKCLKGSSEVKREDLLCAAPEDNQYWDQYRSYRKTTLGRRV